MRIKTLQGLILVCVCVCVFNSAFGQAEVSIEKTKELTKKSQLEEPYVYRPVNGGIEILNGDRLFNRPLYIAPRGNHRLIGLAGDRPEFMLMEINGTKSMNKLANIKLGYKDGAWLSEVEPVFSRYCMGQQQYRLGEAKNEIEVDAIGAMSFEGLLLRIKCTSHPIGPLVVALGGRAKANYDQNYSAAAFNPKECQGMQIKFSGNTLQLSGIGSTLFATSNVPLNYTSANPEAVNQGPDGLCKSRAKGAAVAALVAEWPASGEIFLIFTKESSDSPGLKSFLKSPTEAFAKEIEANRRVATAIEIDTPDSYLNVALPQALIGYNATWNPPTFRHGAIAWHDSYAGWRVTYGGTTAGWHERVQSHMKAFYDKQSEKGRIPAKLGSDGIYNMGEVLCDQALYDWEWTGDLKSLREGGFNAIARHLDWGEKYIKTPNGLYENFLNAWNTDYKWCNGGGGTIASVYYWRANKAMADIAVRLGKDPTVFSRRADEIAAAMKSHLWSERAGVYGEYRDNLGFKLLHESPDLSSIYTPIDLGFCDPFESYRMLRFALRRFETITGLPRNGALIYSSEWLPDHYSTRDIYTAEIINTLLTLYRIGQSEEAEPFRRALDGSFFTGPAPGSTGYRIEPDGTYIPHTDFTDVTSMYIRNVVEGLFGIQMHAPNEHVILQPSFPLEWNKVSIHCPAINYEYSWDGQIDGMIISSRQPLTLTVRLRARRANISAVMVDGKPSRYTVEPGINCAWVIATTERCEKAQVEIIYGSADMPRAKFSSTGIAGKLCTVNIDRGSIEEVYQGSNKLEGIDISTDGTQCNIPLSSDAGLTTYFVRVEYRDVQMWVPVEVDVRAAELADKNPEKEDKVEMQAQTVDLSKFLNQCLADLHGNTYTPRIRPFYWANRDGFRTVQANGRSWWETHGRDDFRPDISRLRAGEGRFTADNGIPFAISTEGNDAVFTSLYENFPDRIEIPVNQRGRKVAVLVAASISLMQSRMENGRITVKLADGTEWKVALRDPETIDDWLGSGTGKSYALSGNPVSLGGNTHGHLYEIDLGGVHMVKSIELETYTNETMIGLLGITIMQEQN